ncbi:MAG: 4'-phosphopantetheinyl transferase superfamily protein [Desulfobacteraceae bacterium]|nr:MAG: 4'-phosphopantetheinyl transferase superfamily protein [Desulfobacteraceae bacterium]
MLRSILARYIGCLPQQIAFSSNAYGKPALAGPADAEDIRFNLAHSRDAVLVALCRSHEVGVDLEYMRALDDLHHIIGRSFSAKERQYLDSLPADQVQRAFFLYWTLKEAFIKGIGLGLSYPLEDFTIERNVSMREEGDLYTITPKAGRCWQGLPLSPCAGYVGALSAESIRGAPRLWSYPG